MIYLGSSLFDSPTLESILQNHDLAKFGDAVVNYVYNMAVFKSQNQLQGIKVWDSCLAEACKASPLRKYVGSRKNKGDLGDAVEAFIAYIIIRNEQKISHIVELLTSALRISVTSKTERELCSGAFTSLLNALCEELEID